MCCSNVQGDNVAVSFVPRDSSPSSPPSSLLGHVADVAVYSTLVATIAPHVLMQGCSAGEDLLWKAYWPGFAGKHADECAPI